MATVQCILQLIVLNGFFHPGLSLSASPPATPFKNPPRIQRLHVPDQKPVEFPRELDSAHEAIDGGRAEAEELELDGATGEDGYNDLNMEQVSPVEQVNEGQRRLVEGLKGHRWVKLGEKDDKDWGKTRDVLTELRTEDSNDGEAQDKRKWGENNMRVWGKRNWEESNAWDRRALSATDKRKWGDNSMSVWGKRLDDGSEKRKWGDNSMSVWGKRSDSDKRTSGHTSSASGKANDTIENRGVTWTPNWAKQEKVKGTGSSQGHRILHKRSVMDEEENLLRDRPRYDWLVQELSKRSRPRLNSQGKPYGGPKRNWETNTMKVWGKRGLVWDTVPNWDDYHSDEEPKESDGKRTWTSENAIRVWGKRNSQPEAGAILVLPMYDQ